MASLRSNNPFEMLPHSDSDQSPAIDLKSSEPLDMSPINPPNENVIEEREEDHHSDLEDKEEARDNHVAPIETNNVDFKKSSVSNFEGQTPAFVSKFIEKQEELNEAEYEINTLKEKLASLKEEKASLDSEIEKIKHVNSQLTSQLQKTVEKKHFAEEKFESVEHALSKYKLEKEHVEHIKDMLEESQVQLKREMEEKVNDYEKQLESMRKELSVAVKKSAYDELETQLLFVISEKNKRESELEEQIGTITTQNLYLTEALNGCQLQIASLEASWAESQQTVLSLQSQLAAAMEEHAGEAQRFQQTREELEAQIQSLEKISKESDTKNASLMKEGKEFQNKMKELQELLASFTAEKERNEEELQDKISSLTVERDVLLTENNDLKKENYIFKAQFDESKQQNFDLMKEIVAFKRDTAARELEAQEQYEELRRAKESVEFLFNELGSEFISFKAETQSKLHVISEERTSEQMRFDAELAKLQKELKNQAATIKSLNEEIQMKDKEFEKTQGAYTKIEKDLSAAESRNAETSTKYETLMKKLRAEIDSQKSQIEDLSSERETLKKEVHKFENKIKKLVGRNDGYFARITTLEKEQGEYIKEVEDLKAHNSSLEFQKRQLEGAIKSLENRLKEQKSMSEEVIKEDKVLHWQYRDLEYQFNLIQGELKSVMAAKTELEIKAKSLQKSLESSRTELEETRKTSDMYHKTIEELESKYRKAQEELKSKLESTLESAQKELSRASSTSTTNTTSAAPSLKKGYSFKWGQHMNLQKMISEKVREIVHPDEHKSEGSNVMSMN